MSTTSNVTSDTLAALQHALQHEDPVIRFNAGLDLVKAGDVAGVRALIEGFAHESASVRLFHASRALVKLGVAAIPDLESALQSANPQVRVAAAYTLYQIEPLRAHELVPVAISALDEANSHAQSDAFDFLGDAGVAAQAAVPRLIEILRKPALMKGSSSWFDDTSVLVAGLLAKIAEPINEIVPALIEALSTDAAEVRWAAACALGEIGAAAQAALPHLRQIASNESELEVARVEALYALAVMGNAERETVPTLLLASQSADWWVRAFVARILGQMGAPPAPPYEIKEFNWLSRLFMAVRNVRRVADPAQAVVPTLTTLLADPDYNVRRNAVWGLAQVGNAAVAAIPGLIAALATPDIGPLSAETLAQIGEVTLPALTQVRKLGDANQQTYAAYALDLLNALPTEQPKGRDGFRPTAQHFYIPVPVQLDADKCAAFETLYQATLAQDAGQTVQYTLPYPKHEFLRYLVAYKGLLIHGSGKTDIDVLKPMRYGIDAADHGNVSGIYADRDSVRPIYFAVIDGKRCFGQHNGFIDLTPAGQISENEDQGFDRRFYKLAIGVNGLRRNPWRQGMIYILPPDTFTYQREWTSRAPVAPLIRLPVTPDDLPLRLHVWGADWRKMEGDYWVRHDDPFPFLKDVRITPILPSGKPAWLSQHE
jgi:HEAT repeat protein